MRWLWEVGISSLEVETCRCRVRCRTWVVGGSTKREGRVHMLGLKIRALRDKTSRRYFYTHETVSRGPSVSQTSIDSRCQMPPPSEWCSNMFLMPIGNLNSTGDYGVPVK